MNCLSEWAISDSPFVHITEGEKSRPFVTLPYKHRHSPEWEAAVRYAMHRDQLCRYFYCAVLHVYVIHKRECIMHSKIRWMTLKQSMFSVKVTGLYEAWNVKG